MKNSFTTRPRRFRNTAVLFALLSFIVLPSCTKEDISKPNQEIVWTPVSHSSCIKPADLQTVKVNMTEAVITWRECPAAYEYRVIDAKNLNDFSASASDITTYTSKIRCI